MPVEQLIAEIVKQAPGIGAIIFIVLKFLHHIDRIADRAEAADEKRNEVIEANTQALGLNTGAMMRAEEAIERLERVVPRPRRPAGGSDPAAPTARP